jgi:predicted RNA-binding protein with PIN domain
VETIIDGYNLLMKISFLAEKLRGGEVKRSREMLIHLLQHSKRKELKRATVVFDSPGLKPGTSPPSDLISLSSQRQMCGSVGIVFSPSGIDADTVIKEFMEERELMAKGREVRVITSDRQVASYARRLGARIESSEECARGLLRPIGSRHRNRRKQEPVEPGKATAAPSAEDVQAWLEYFDIDDDQPIEL